MCVIDILMKRTGQDRGVTSIRASGEISYMGIYINKDRTGESPRYVRRVKYLIWVYISTKTGQGSHLDRCVG